MLFVQKYGGTSVGSADRLRVVADRVQKTVAAGHQVVVVVSAMGHSTDALVKLADDLVSRPDLREMDSLLSTGEQVSASLLAMRLVHMGCQAKSLTGWQAGIQTEKVHGKARISSIDTNALSVLLHEGVTPIVTGFQGVAGGEITTLGRGGSDTTAVALAAALKADACEIYTDVDGVYTTDPRVVSTAKKLSSVSYDEMLELANLGAQVLHPRAVENAKQFDVQLVVRSSFSGEDGTRVVAISDDHMEERKVVTGIAFERHVARIAVIGLPVHRHGLAVIFSELARNGVNVDVIVQSVVGDDVVDVSFSVTEPDALSAVEIVRGLKEQLMFSRVERETDLAKVSIVGAGMISNPGVAAEMFVTLRDANIPIHMVTTSEIKVSCVVPARFIDGAVSALHHSFVDALDASVATSERAGL